MGGTVTYECKNGYFAHGVNSDILTTVCQVGGKTYSNQAEDLAECARIC